MYTLFVVLILLASLLLGLIILIQNPKGGGLSGTFGGVGNQMMGVKQTTDTLEKGTWIFFGLVAFLCILSPVFIKKGGNTDKGDRIESINPKNVPQKAATPAPATPVKPN